MKLATALDMAGAFDAVWRKGGIAKLQRLVMVLLILVEDCLHERTMKVVLQDYTFSFPIEITAPQGNVIGALL